MLGLELTEVKYESFTLPGSPGVHLGQDKIKLITAATLTEV